MIEELPEFRKTFKIRTDVDPFSMIYEAIGDLYQKYGFKPIGVLVGPDDYVYLVQSVRKKTLYGAVTYELNQPTAIFGLPVRLKSTNGIELELPVEKWCIFARGLNE